MSNAAMRGIDQLLEIMSALRHPETGCPWDIAQTHTSLRPYVLEEAYEVADAIDDGDTLELRGELGDLLLQVVFHAQIAKENGDYDFDAVARAVAQKMIDRHPHIFGDENLRTAAEQRIAWEETKARERGDQGVLDGVARALPALTRALKLQKRAARVGFDWIDSEDIRNKINEELDELSVANENQQAGEFGDLLFTLVNYGRHLGIDPEAALEATNAKFVRRFAHIETTLAKNNKAPHEATLEQLELIWREAKFSEG